MNITQEHIDKLRKMASTLPPFTITITDPNEATALVSAYIFQAGGDRATAQMLSIALGASCKTLGIEQGIDAWLVLMEGTKPPLPRFMKPLLMHFFTHMEQQKEKE